MLSMAVEASQPKSFADKGMLLNAVARLAYGLSLGQLASHTFYKGQPSGMRRSNEFKPELCACRERKGEQVTG